MEPIDPHYMPINSAQAAAIIAILMYIFDEIRVFLVHQQEQARQQPQIRPRLNPRVAAAMACTCLFPLLHWTNKLTAPSNVQCAELLLTD